MTDRKSGKNTLVLILMFKIYVFLIFRTDRQTDGLTDRDINLEEP
jgi:hypothetical protein